MTPLRRRVAGGRLKAAAVALLLSSGAIADDSAFTSDRRLGNLDGPQIYSHICQGCHMPNGQGAAGAGRYPKLSGDPALASWEYVARTVLNGRNDMPAFGRPAGGFGPFQSVHLTDAQIAAVVNYVRNSFGNQWRSKVTEQQVAAIPHPAASVEMP